MDNLQTMSEVPHLEGEFTVSSNFRLNSKIIVKRQIDLKECDVIRRLKFSEAPVSDSPALINHLPNELLDYIFTFLDDIQERIKIERVCKRWRILGTGNSWSKPKYLELDGNVWSESSVVLKNDMLTNSNLNAILSRCGTCLKILEISNGRHCQVPFTGKMLDIIAKCCPNLIQLKLELPTLPSSRNCFSKLAGECQKLKSLRLSCGGCRNLILAPIFKQCEFLELKGDICLGESDFEEINRNLQVLRLECSFSSHQPELLSKLLDRCNCLQELRLTNRIDFQLLTPDCLLKLADRYCNTLKVLEVNFFGLNIIRSWCTALSKLRILEELYVGSNEVVPFGPLENMSGNIKVFHAKGIEFGPRECYFDEDFVKKVLETSKNLQELSLENCYKFNPDTLTKRVKHAQSLKKLTFLGCWVCSIVTNIRHHHWCELFEYLPNLEMLTLDYLNTAVNDKVAMTLSIACPKLVSLSLVQSCISDKGLLAVSSLPCLMHLNVRDSFREITDVGITVLARQGQLKMLNISNIYTDANAEITDVSCCELARCCPKFCELTALNVVNISDALVAEFCSSLETMYWKHNVTLNLSHTSVSDSCKRHKRLLVNLDDDLEDEYYEEDTFEDEAF